jgi:hypothetical protein
MDYRMPCRVRESAVYLAEAATDAGVGGAVEQAAYLVRLGETPDGTWYVHLMALPWDSHIAENTFATAQQACEAADALYAMGTAGGRWDVRRWGWQRPQPPAGPAGSSASAARGR